MTPTRSMPAILGYRNDRLVAISLHGELGFDAIADDWKARGYRIVTTTEKLALETWHRETGNPSLQEGTHS